MDKWLGKNEHILLKVTSALKHIKHLIFFVGEDHLIKEVWADDLTKSELNVNLLVNLPIASQLSNDFKETLNGAIHLAFLVNKISEFEYQEKELIYKKVNIQKIEVEQEDPVVIVTIQDITEKINHEKNIKSNEAILNAILSNSTKEIFALNTNLEITIFNKQFAENVSLVELGNPQVGQSIFELIYPEDVKLVFKNMLLECLRGESVEFVERFDDLTQQLKGGIKKSYIYKKITLHPITIDGLITGISAFMENITEQIIGLEKIKSNQILLQSIIDNTNEYIFLVDKNAKLLLANQPYKQLILERFNIEYQKIENEIVSQVNYPQMEALKDWEYRFNKALEGNYAIYEDLFGEGENELFVEISYFPIKINGKVENVSIKIKDITNRIQQKMQLVTMANQTKSLIESTEDIMVLIDNDYRILIHNKAYLERFLNYTDIDKGENNLINVLNKFDNKIGKHWLDVLNKCKESGEVIKSTEQYYFLGRKFYFEVIITPVISENQIQGFAVYGRNITNDVEVNQKLSNSEETLKHALEATGEGVWEYDVVKDVMTNTPEWLKKIGILDDDYDGTIDAYYKRIHPEDRYLVSVAMNSYINGNTSIYELEHRFIKPNGEILWVLDKGKFVKWDESGQPLRMVGAILDITDKKRSEAELLKQKSYTENIINLVPNLIFVKNKDKKFTLVNKAVQEIYGRTESELIGKSDNDISQKQNEIQHFNTIDDEVINTQQGIFVPEEQVTNPITGLTKWFQTVKVPLIFDNEVFVLGVATDITERKYAENEKGLLIDQLTKRNDEMEQFTYIISHNLRAPVAKILGLAELYDPEESNIELNKFIYSSLLSETKALDSIIMDLNEIIALRRLGVDNATLVNLESTFLEVMTLLNSDIEIIKAKINYDFNRVKEVIGIKSYFHSIFYNLLSNSIKYKSPNRTLEVEIYCFIKGKEAILTFQDNGSGIDLEKYGSKIFQLYKRFHQGGTGRGIGLHITKAQIEMMGGTIEMRSSVDVGTSFSIRLPYQQNDDL